MGNPRNPALDLLSPRHPVFRRAVWALPDLLQPKEKKCVWVLAVDAAGQVVHDLQADGDVDGFHLVTGVREAGGTVWLGSLVARSVAALRL